MQNRVQDAESYNSRPAAMHSSRAGDAVAVLMCLMCRETAAPACEASHGCTCLWALDGSSSAAAAAAPTRRSMSACAPRAPPTVRSEPRMMRRRLLHMRHWIKDAMQAGRWLAHRWSQRAAIDDRREQLITMGCGSAGTAPHHCKIVDRACCSCWHQRTSRTDTCWQRSGRAPAARPGPPAL